jgi:hypothetical protein
MNGQTTRLTIPPNSCAKPEGGKVSSPVRINPTRRKKYKIPTAVVKRADQKPRRFAEWFFLITASFASTI